MHEIVAKILGNLDGSIALIVTVVIGLNVLLMSLLKFLGWLKDKTESKADDKAHAFLNKLLGHTLRALAFASANSAAFPPKAKAELDKGEWEVRGLAESTKEQK